MEMTKKEEMAYIITNFALKNKNGEPVGSVADHYARQIAEALYNAGYRKVTDGVVILTPEERDEEMEEINKTLAERDELKAEIAELKSKIEELKLKCAALFPKGKHPSE